jgi:hypothetical protein
LILVLELGQTDDPETSRRPEWVAVAAKC